MRATKKYRLEMTAEAQKIVEKLSLEEKIFDKDHKEYNESI